MKIIIATIKSWNIERAQKLQQEYSTEHEIRICTQKEELSPEAVQAFGPDYILLPHWSYILQKEITQNYHCVVFHMTDLPYGRGGSPLQNLIIRGHKTTKISAIRVTDQIDAGPIYMKKELSLEGSAQEIFIRCADIIFGEMIPCFLQETLTPKPQEGEPVIFKRRKAEESIITPDMNPETVYNMIRMLDAEGYPRAFLDFGEYRLEFSAASLSEDGQQVEARVIFHKQDQ